MHFDTRIPLFWAVSLFLVLLSMMVNSRLAPFSLYLILLGPILITPALHFKPSPLILYAFITGISIDALLPLPFWLFVYGLPAIGLLIRSIRSHFRTENSDRRFLLAHIANFACISLLSVGQCIYFGQILPSLLQISVIILFSHATLCMITSWFFSFERLIFQLLNIEYAHEDELSTL